MIELILTNENGEIVESEYFNEIEEFDNYFEQLEIKDRDGKLIRIEFDKFEFNFKGKKL